MECSCNPIPVSFFVVLSRSHKCRSREYYFRSHLVPTSYLYLNINLVYLLTSWNFPTLKPDLTSPRPLQDEDQILLV